MSSGLHQTFQSRTLLARTLLEQVSKLLMASFASVLFGFLVGACQPPTDTVDETQTQLREANVSLARLNTIEDEIRPYGLNLRAPSHSNYDISRRSTIELQILQTKLTEYIAEGSKALRIANRADVAFADRAGLANRVGNARMMLQEVKSRLGIGAESPALFWTTWIECNSTHQQNLVIYGISILHFDPVSDTARLTALPRQHRREIAVRARRYQQCEGIISQARARSIEGTKYKAGISKPYDSSGQPIDPLAPPSPQQRNLKSLLDAVSEN